MELIEQTGERFDLNAYFEARRLCREVVVKIASQVTVGMTEADGQMLIKEVFREAGVLKFWHPSKFRIGSDTVKSFRDLPDQNITLTSGEIFFIDVGPIIEGQEADFGETFIFAAPSQSSDLKTLADASKKVWRHTAQAWSEGSLTGKALYDQASEYSKKLGYKLNPQMAGHRLGDFPHALFSKEKLSSLEFVPSTNLWVLEIQIISESQSRGAFFEDILSNW